MKSGDYSKKGITLAGIYAGIFISLLVFFFVLNPQRSEFAGVYFILMTLPWSIALVVLTTVLDSSGHPDAIPFSVNIILLTLAAALNALFIYKLASDTERK